MEWISFADGNQALIRVPATGDADLRVRPAERYHGRRHGWVGPYRGWTLHDQVTNAGRYDPVDPAQVPDIQRNIDAMEPDPYRDRSRFWPDQAHLWTDERARRRAARLEAETGPDSSHWTVQSYFDGVHELEGCGGSPAIDKYPRPIAAGGHGQTDGAVGRRITTMERAVDDTPTTTRRMNY
jgi:hypothetical protein